MNVGSEWLDFSPMLHFAHALGVIWISNNLPDTLKTHVYPETARVFHDHMKYWWIYVCKDYWMVVAPADSLLQSTWTNAFWKEKVFHLEAVTEEWNTQLSKDTCELGQHHSGTYGNESDTECVRYLYFYTIHDCLSIQTIQSNTCISIQYMIPVVLFLCLCLRLFFWGGLSSVFICSMII